MEVVLICVICAILFLVTNGASKAFGKSVGTIVGVGCPIMVLGGIGVAVFAYIAPFVMAVVIPLALFAGASLVVLKLLGLVKSGERRKGGD